jgi:hypothetical protein
MKDNAALFDKGMAKAAKLISQHLNKILSEAADDLVAEAFSHRVQVGHNMTGNTVTSYAAGVYDNGRLVKVHLGGSKDPVQRKISPYDVFPAGRIRWDGDVQNGDFAAIVSTDRNYGYNSVREWLQGVVPTKNGFQICVMSGVEYASFQEKKLGIDVLTAIYLDAEAIFQSHIRPIE